MDMQSIRDNRGAVSVFLILVLVPCIALSCIFVDLSRVEMAKASAESAADLALNTLLTNYDADLSEYYGLIGSCQNIDDFYKVSAEYFLRTISSQGLSDDEILLLSGVYANATSDDTIYDLLQVECKSDTGKMVTPVAGANLGAPAMLKDSIVEFMKYRGPIAMASALIGRLQQSDSGVEEFLQSDENEELVKAKQDFYQAQGELMEAAIYTYLAILAYETEAAGPPKYSNTQLKYEEEKINSYRDAYEQIHKVAVPYLLNTSRLTGVYERVTYDINQYNSANIKDLPDVYSSTGQASDGSTIYYLNGNDLQTQIQAAKNSITNLNTAVNSYVNATSDLMQKYEPAANGYNAVQWWVDMHNAVYRGSYGNLHETIKTEGLAVMNAYKKIKAMREGCVAEPKPSNAGSSYVELPTDWQQTCDTTLNSLLDSYNKFLSDAAPKTDAYIKAAEALAKVSAANLDKVKCSSHKVTVDKTAMPVDNAVIYIAGALNGLHKKYDKIIDLLDTAIDGDGGDTKSLDKLLSLAKTYGVEFKDYDKAADDSTTNMGKTERDEIDTLTLESKINETSVKELKTRLENIRDQFCVLRTEIETLTYGSEPLRDIRSFSAFSAAALTVVSDANIPLNQQSLDNYADTTFDQLFKPSKADAIKLEHTDDDNYNPNLNIKTPELYAYMKSEFQDVRLDDLKKESEDEKDAKADQEDHEKKVKESATTYRGNTDATMTKTYGWKETFGVTDMLGSIVDLVKDLLDGNFTNIRDDMYVTTYVMEMFSYATFDREAMYRNLTVEQRKAMMPSDADTEHTYFKNNNVYGDPKGDLENQPKMWVSTSPSDTFNKSLTNKMITYSNNHVYLAEVEYLLYGKSKPADNLKEAYGDIYALRFTLNTISAFQNFWGGTTTTGAVLDGISGAISGMFGGVVPPPVIKAVLLPILAAMETCKDNERLFAGMPVELYKVDESYWWMALAPSDGGVQGYGAFFDALMKKDAGTEKKNQDRGFFYSDYMTLFVYCAFTNAKSEDDMYMRLAELIEANITKVVKSSGKTLSEAYSLKNTQMYFQLNAELRVKPLMVTVPYYLDEYDNEMDTATDWCTFKVKTVRGYS